MGQGGWNRLPIHKHVRRYTAMDRRAFNILAIL
jgi:hypothetical protein